MSSVRLSVRLSVTDGQTEVSIKTHIDCILNISTIILTVLCMYITAPPVNYFILCLSSIVHIVAFVNLLLKKMVVVVVVTLVDQDHLSWKSWKLIARTISPTRSLLVAQRPSTYSHGNTGKFGGE